MGEGRDSLGDATQLHQCIIALDVQQQQSVSMNIHLRDFWKIVQPRLV